MQKLNETFKTFKLSLFIVIFFIINIIGIMFLFDIIDYGLITNWEQCLKTSSLFFLLCINVVSITYGHKSFGKDVCSHCGKECSIDEINDNYVKAEQLDVCNLCYDKLTDNEIFI